jgi:flagellar biosynthesis protein FlhG
MLANMVRSAAQGRDVYDKLSKVVHRFLDVNLLYEGFVPEDEYLRKAIQRQKAVVNAYPRSRAALAFRRLAMRSTQWPVPTTASGHIAFFFERAVHELEAMENVG